MIKDNEHIGHYNAEQGKVIVPKGINKDNYFASYDIWLSKFDNINNYEEISIKEYEKIKKQFELLQKLEEGGETI